MKYTKTELEILRQGGKKALEEFHKANRKCSSTRANCFIESKKYKDEKHRTNFEDQSFLFQLNILFQYDIRNNSR